MGWSSIFTGSDALQKWSPELDAFAVSRLGQRPSVTYGSGDYAGEVYGGDPNAAAEWDRRYRAEIEPAFIQSLSPDRQAAYLAAKGDRSSTISKSNSLSKGLAMGAIGASGLGAGLTAGGLLGGGSGVTAGAIESAVGIPELGLAAQTTAPAASSGGGLLSSLGSGLGSVGSWAAANPGLVSMLGGALAAAGGGSGGSGGGSQMNFAPQPGLNFGTLQQPDMPRQAGTLTGSGGSGLLNSGLGRFGAAGGTYTPTPYTPKSFTWGR